jgi:hypothetical protein
MKTMHGMTLEVVANALGHRSDPSTAPDIIGMEGIPQKDLEDFKSRAYPATLSTPNQQKFGKQGKAEKKVKVDGPLSTETIQAQLAEFQKKKDDQEIQDLVKQGITFPPGLSPRESLHLFSFSHPPPGSGPYATRTKSQLIPPVNHFIPSPIGNVSGGFGRTFPDGKSDALVTPNSLVTSVSPKFVSKSAFFRWRLIVDLLLHQVSSLRNSILFLRFPRPRLDLVRLDRKIR